MNNNIQPFKRVFILPVLLFILNYAAIGQRTNSYVPNILGPSPNVSALMKFTDIPVSLYTGTADVSIPFYTIKAKDFTLPVNLAYHTGGIRLKEEATSVGLGWVLNYGGAISRTIMDKDDFNSTAYFDNTIPQLQGDVSSTQFAQDGLGSYLGPYYLDFWCNYKVNFSSGTANYHDAFVPQFVTFDMEPDIYSYNFAGKSGKFIITRDRKVILQKQDNIKIQFENNGNSFTVTDAEGNVYYFNDKEYAQTASMIGGPISTWNITKITTAQNDVINFIYSTGASNTFLAPDQYEIWNAFTEIDFGYITGSNSGVSYSNMTIQTIDFPAGQLQFSYDATRADLQNATKLNTIKLYSKSAGILKYLKEYDFTYSYFNDDTQGRSNSWEYLRLRLDAIKEAGTGISTPPYSFSYQLPPAEYSSKKHSYSVDHWGFYNGKSNTTFLPSTAVYYNPPVLPNPKFPSTFFTYTGADRSPDFSYMSSFALNQINYPTGGKSVFEYEENNIDQQKSVTGPQDFPYSQLVTIQKSIQVSTPGSSSGSVDLSNIFPMNNPGSPNPVQNGTLFVAFRAADAASLTALHNSGNISFTFGNITESIGNSANNCSGSVCGINVPMYITGHQVVSWSAYIDPYISSTSFINIQVTVQWQEVQSVANQQTSNDFRIPSGGLRIKSITDFSNSGTIAKKRTYNYEYTTTTNGVTAYYTNGKQMSFPSYVRYNPIIQSDGVSMSHALTLSGNSNTSVTSEIQGNIVGYSQVTEKTINPSDNSDNGQTIYTYSNFPDITVDYHGYRMPGVLNLGNNLNGSLLSQTHFRNKNGTYYPVSSDVNTYYTTNRIVYYSPKYESTGNTANVGSMNSCPMNQTDVESEKLICLYPSVNSEKILQGSAIHTDYDEPGNIIQTAKNYFYDNPLHYQLTRSQQTDSKNNLHVSQFTYPQDYIPLGSTVTGNTILDLMITKNIVSPVIEKTEKLYQSGATTNAVTGSILNIWRQLPATNTITLDKQFQLSAASSLTDFQPFHVTNNTTTQDNRYRQMISFDSYDNTNNINQYTSTDLLPNAFIWDYSYNYPIAQVKNATQLNIAYTSFEADGKGNWNYTGTVIPVTVTPFPPTGNKYYNLTPATALSKSVTSGSVYIVSYWSKNGSYTISGGTGTLKTGRSLNGWIYYEHKITATSATLTITGTGSIDEVRLYPDGAQMATSTYEPLTGITSQCDVNNRITYYEYDNFQRLKLIRDQDNNIIKRFDYQYQQPQ